MNKHNQAPSPEAERNPEILHYSDGYRGVSYTVPGDTITLATTPEDALYPRMSIGVGNVIAHYESFSKATIVKTESDRQLGYMEGLAFDMGRFEFEELPAKGVYPVTVGEQSDLPFVAGERVKEVIVRSDYPVHPGVEDTPKPQPGDSVIQKRVHVDYPSNFGVLHQMAMHVMRDRDEALIVREEAKKAYLRSIKAAHAERDGITLPPNWA